ncbi:single-stranded DNA-binding protein [Pseudoflavonifractor phocaeensis]|uniref:single-stranded DNA-binding protein n=1 Tax=Pseudoflavonifractor phocaeensis TaxID=1870988 RepID=UPI001F3B8438|nr:single-stranded DNA-binding protein [Pseudoflavonifractor phocaeensis]MCF2595576.1 single-stranded DNA-binding protein [Pseudoflavonifractor phocaeensis]MDY3906318.1 single-stranded DNA-binding protein [Lawsonibacter sp.]
MRQNSADLNRIQLHGRVEAPPVLSHSNHGVEFYRFPIAVVRLSGAEDRINVVAAGPLLDRWGAPEPGEELTVRGEVRTFNNRTGVGNRLVISTFAKELVREQGEDENRLELTGTLCKPPSLRTTPLGRSICDMILAVNRRYGRADYLPCIAWGSLAYRCGDLAVGDQLRLNGRLQSRVYTKTVEERTEERTAFEVSVMSMSQKEDAVTG